MHIFQAGFTYFALVFGAGFLLGAIRVTLLVPSLGVRFAELLEMPVMLVAILLAARFIVSRFTLSRAIPVRLGVGAIALSLLLCTEFSLAFVIQGQSVSQHIAGKDPVSGSVFAAMLIVFACMPLLLALKGARYN